MLQLVSKLHLYNTSRLPLTYQYDYLMVLPSTSAKQRTVSPNPHKSSSLSFSSSCILATVLCGFGLLVFCFVRRRRDDQDGVAVMNRPLCLQDLLLGVQVWGQRKIITFNQTSYSHILVDSSIHVNIADNTQWWWPPTPIVIDLIISLLFGCPNKVKYNLHYTLQYIVHQTYTLISTRPLQ